MKKDLNLRANIALGLIFAFLVNTMGIVPLAQAGPASAIGGEFYLPAPGAMVSLSPQFNPPILKGLKVHPDNPFRFDFILDKGDGDVPLMASLRDESTKLIKYFLASLTIPETDLWVNLSPYEKDRIIPDSFGLTEMGRDLLAEDYMLKQITASLIYPEDKIGKKFWKRIYEEAYKKFGTTDIPVNTFNKVWILPEKAVVYENAKAGTAYVIESKLKVMLEQDYLSLQKHISNARNNKQLTTSKQLGLLGANIIREIVIPELTKEVNEGKNFSRLRQVYNSLILAAWYKKKIRDSILEQVYADKNKIQGLVIPAKVGPQTGHSQELGIHNNVEFIYQRYLQAFKKGAFNYIKEEAEVDPRLPSKEQGVFPRKYFSGGVNCTNLVDMAMTFTHIPPANAPDREFIVQAELSRYGTQSIVSRDQAMTTQEKALLDRFWRGEIDELDVTEIFRRSRVEKGKIPEDFRFEGKGEPVGSRYSGTGRGKPGDRMFIVCNEHGEIIFERRREGKTMASAIWVKSKDGTWENKGDPYQWEFWSGRVNTLDITDMLGSKAKRGVFNDGFRFELNGFRPQNDQSIGIGHLNEGERIWMTRLSPEEFVFQRKAGEQLIEEAHWIKTQEQDGEKNYIWINKEAYTYIGGTPTRTYRGAKRPKTPTALDPKESVFVVFLHDQKREAIIKCFIDNYDPVTKKFEFIKVYAALKEVYDKRVALGMIQRWLKVAYKSEIESDPVERSTYVLAPRGMSSLIPLSGLPIREDKAMTRRSFLGVAAAASLDRLNAWDQEPIEILGAPYGSPYNNSQSSFLENFLSFSKKMIEARTVINIKGKTTDQIKAEYQAYLDHYMDGILQGLELADQRKALAALNKRLNPDPKLKLKKIDAISIEYTLERAAAFKIGMQKIKSFYGIWGIKIKKGSLDDLFLYLYGPVLSLEYKHGLGHASLVSFEEPTLRSRSEGIWDSLTKSEGSLSGDLPPGDGRSTFIKDYRTILQKIDTDPDLTYPSTQVLNNLLEEYRNKGINIIPEKLEKAIKDYIDYRKIIRERDEYASQQVKEFAQKGKKVLLYMSTERVKSLESRFKEIGLPFQNLNKAMPVDRGMSVKGGIDLTPANMNLLTKTDSSPAAQNDGGIKFYLDPVMLKQLQNAPGFVPVIINIQPLNDLKQFLGVDAE